MLGERAGNVGRGNVAPIAQRESRRTPRRIENQVLESWRRWPGRRRWRSDRRGIVLEGSNEEHQIADSLLAKERERRHGRARPTVLNRVPQEAVACGALEIRMRQTGRTGCAFAALSVARDAAFCVEATGAIGRTLDALRARADRATPRKAAEVRDDGVDRRTGERAPARLAPGGHWRSRSTVRDRSAQELVGGNGEEVCIADRIRVVCGIPTSIRRVTQRTVSRVRLASSGDPGAHRRGSRRDGYRSAVQESAGASARRERSRREHQRRGEERPCETSAAVGDGTEWESGHFGREGTRTAADRRAKRFASVRGAEDPRALPGVGATWQGSLR